MGSVNTNKTINIREKTSKQQEEGHTCCVGCRVGCALGCLLGLFDGWPVYGSGRQ